MDGSYSLMLFHLLPEHVLKQKFNSSLHTPKNMLFLLKNRKKITDRWDLRPPSLRRFLRPQTSLTSSGSALKPTH